MKSLVQHLAGYAAYHRNGKNIVTHMAGIPIIVLAVAVLLSRQVIALGTIAVTPTMVVAAILAAFYLRLDLRFGLAMTILLALATWAGLRIGEQATAIWLGAGIGLFVFGWVLQFIGHFYEGRKPAFIDDIMGLAIGPLFIVAEIAFRLGLRRDVHRAIEGQVGTGHLG